MLKQVHFLLTYLCNFECDHCFLFCSPCSTGTFTLAQVKLALAQAQEVATWSGFTTKVGSRCCSSLFWLNQ